jgi:hypothetical protein
LIEEQKIVKKVLKVAAEEEIDHRVTLRYFCEQGLMVSLACMTLVHVGTQSRMVAPRQLISQEEMRDYSSTCEMERLHQ